MSSTKSTTDIQTHKSTTITNFSAFLDSLINSPEPTDPKRADLICYWLKDFQQYLSQEKEFDAKRIKSYKRGDVIKVNLGFNVGSEQGGLRYAIVLDKENRHNAKTITIIPLSSQKTNKPINDRDISLGQELYSRLKSKYDSAFETLTQRRIDCDKKMENVTFTLDILRKILTNTSNITLGPPDEHASIQDLIAAQTENLEHLRKEEQQIHEEEQSLQKISAELHRMRNGSVAKIEQITTISKQRIYDPKKSGDVLDGIRFSDAAMEKINEKLKELYIF